MSKYSVENYNPEWVMKFHGIEKMLGEVFGVKALAVEHVGSTSIPGMKAKPIIDILVVVENIGVLEKEKEVMKEHGYRLEENYIAPDTCVFYKIDETGNKTENIHVTEVGSPMEKQFITIRDYLRVFPERASDYANLKDSLFVEFPNDYVAYRSGKQSFLKRLEQEAYNWKEKI